MNPYPGGLQSGPGAPAGGGSRAGSAGRRLGAQPLRTCRQRGDAARPPAPVCGVPESASSHRPPRGARSAFLKSLILTVAKALRNTAHCWQLPGGSAELGRQRREKKRERLGSAPAAAATPRHPPGDRERPARREGPLYVLLSRSWTRRSRPRSPEQTSQRRKVSAAGDAGWAPASPVLRGQGLPGGRALGGAGE